MNSKLITMVVGAAAILSTAGVAFAMSMTGDTMKGDTMMKGDAMKGSPSAMMMMHPPAPMILTVSDKGMGRLRGVVSAVGTNSLTVAAWGGNWTINISGDTKVVPGVFADIKVGDYVGAMGSVSEDSPTMTADIVRDWTGKRDNMMMRDEKMMKKDEMKDTMHDKMMQGSSSGTMMH